MRPACQVLHALKGMRHQLFETQSQLVELGHTQHGAGAAESPELTKTLTDLYIECQHAATMLKVSSLSIDENPPPAAPEP